MNTFVGRALEKIKKASSRKHKELRDACSAALDLIKSELDAGEEGDNADKFFECFKLACETKQGKILEIALDNLQKLIAYGYLTGRSKDIAPSNEPDRTLMDTVIETICNCNEQPDDAVQLQVIKALLTAVTSSTCEVHGTSLLMAVRACYHIHLVSKNLVNQTTAKATLTQMLNVVFQRMESLSTVRPQAGASVRETVANQMTDIESAVNPLEDWLVSYTLKVVDDVCVSEGKQFKDHGGDQRMALDVNELGAPAGKFGWCIQCRNTADHYCLQTKDPVCSHPCKRKNLERLELVNRLSVESVNNANGHVTGDREGDREKDRDGPGLQALAAAASQVQDSSSVMDAATNEFTDKSGPKNLSGFGNVYQKDAFIVFRALCKLSMKQVPEGSVADPISMRSKILSLELLLSVLENSGPAFRSGEKFIAAIKQLLCVSILRNCVSAVPSIFGLSLSIFVTLMTHFKDFLKNEIGVFVEQIFLKILESGNSSFQHKHLVLQVFFKICEDAQTAVELFLNYDCDVEEKDIFERMVECLAKIAQGKYSKTEHTNLIQPQQESALRMIALESLVTIMHSLVDWTKRLAEDKEVVQTSSASARDDDSDSEDNVSVTSTEISASSLIDHFEKQRATKTEIQKGVAKFNLKPKKGIEFLQQKKILETGDKAPESIARFFRTTVGLDKTKVGEYMGEDNPLALKTMYAYVESMSFKDMEIDTALRVFLSGFRLPGEAQKIDRMMEKFAERYTNDNPNLFANADCAYVLAFAIIMLQTDAHNPGVKAKMTKQGFFRNNAGINDGQNLPEELLSAIYDRVVSTPFSLKDDEEAKIKLQSQQATGKKKAEMFSIESALMLKESTDHLKSKTRRKTAFVSAAFAEHVKPMFEVTWPAMLACFSALLQETEDPRVIALCLDGLGHCVHVSSYFGYDEECEAFVSSLAKFTNLATVREMKPKNIDCIKTLISLAQSDGNYLRKSWYHVLDCISRLDRLQVISLGARSDDHFFPLENRNSTSKSTQRRPRVSPAGVTYTSAELAQLELSVSEQIIHSIDFSTIDYIFTHSVQLSGDAIVHFVEKLCQVSTEELENPESPRIFSLQKIVEVADFNMARIRIDWNRIWKVLSEHFVSVGCHPNLRVAMYAIDSLKQLSMKFLEKDELANYQFQNQFLRPFEHVMINSQSLEIRELIVSCMANMVKAKVQNIRSGWRTMFHIFIMAAQDQHESLVALSFGVVEQILTEYFSLINENFVELVNCLVAFGSNIYTNISLKSIHYLSLCSGHLAEGHVMIPSVDGPPSPKSASGSFIGSAAGSAASSAARRISCVTAPSLYTDDKGHLKVWFPILTGLSRLIGDSRFDVRARALDVLFDILKHHGTKFHADLWVLIFKGVLFPIFDSMNYGEQGTYRDDEHWLKTTCLSALMALIDLFSFYFDRLVFLIGDMLDLHVKCVRHQNESMARIGVSGLKQLIVQTGDRFTVEIWQSVVQTMATLVFDTTPKQLMDLEIVNNRLQLLSPPTDQDEPLVLDKNSLLPFDADRVVTKCVVQLLLIDAFREVIDKHYPRLSVDLLMTLLAALEDSFRFAEAFNGQFALREKLWKDGFMSEMRQLPGLLKQEREALACAVKVLFRLFSDPRTESTQFATIVEDKLFSICVSVLRQYVRKDSEGRKEIAQYMSSNILAAHPQPPSSPLDARQSLPDSERDREVISLTPIVANVVLRGLLDLKDEQFLKHLSDIYPVLADLTMCGSIEVRAMARQLFLKRVSVFLPVKFPEYPSPAPPL